MEQSTGSVESSQDLSAESVDVSSEESQDFESQEGEGFEGEEVDSGTPEELEAQVQEAVENGASKEEIKQMIKEFELKVNGKTVKTKIDLADEEAIKRELQKAYAFNDVSQKYSQLENALKAKIEAWKRDPELAIQDLGFDPAEVAEKTLEKRIERAKMTPEQIENERIKQELQQYKEREEKIKAQLEAQEEARKDQEALSILKAEINEALSNHETLKPNQYTERRVADLMAYYSGLTDEYGNQKYPNITAEQVLPVLEREIEREFSTILENVPDAAIERFLSRKVLDRISPKPAPKKVPKKTVPSSPASVRGAASANSVQPKEEKKATFEELMSRRSW